MLITLDGKHIVKPAHPLEIQFYRSIQSQSDFDSWLTPLKSFIPKFYDTLNLERALEYEGHEAGAVNHHVRHDLRYKDEFNVFRSLFCVLREVFTSPLLYKPL